MVKTYVVDTNVLIQSPNAIESFEENDVVIPIVVIEELDSLKNAEGEKGANARSAIRLFEKYRQTGDLLKGISSLVISLLRLFVIVLTLAYVFTLFTNATDIMWLAFPIAELVALIVAIALLKRAKDKVLVIL